MRFTAKSFQKLHLFRLIGMKLKDYNFNLEKHRVHTNKLLSYNFRIGNSNFRKETFEKEINVK